MPSQVPDRKFPTGIVLALTLLVAFLLRLIHLGYKPFWSDEGVIWFMAQGKIEHDAPRIYYYAFNWAIQLFGTSEYAARLPSALYGVLSVVVVYMIGKMIWDRKYGLYAAALAAMSAYLIPLSQELRHYSLVGLELWLALWVFLHLFKGENAHWGWWMSLLLVGLIGEYTHCLFIFVLAYFGLVYLFKVGWQNWRAWRRYLAIFSVILLLSLPRLLNTISVAGERPQLFATDLHVLKMNGYTVLRSYFSFIFGDYLTNLPGSILIFLKSHPAHLALGICMVVVWIAIAWRSLRVILKIHRAGDFTTYSLRMLSGMLIFCTALFFIIGVSTAGHLIFLYVPFVFLITTTFSYKNSLYIKILLVAFILLTSVSLFSYFQAPNSANERTDWKAAANLLKQQMQPEDALLILRPRNTYYTLLYYYPELKGDIYYRPRHEGDLQRNPLGMEWWNETNTAQKVDSLLENHTRLWLVESDRNWEAGGGLPGYSGKTWKLGDELQVHLIGRWRTNKNPR